MYCSLLHLALVRREEIIEHYSRLTLEAARREQRALWRVRRWQLQPQRMQLLGAAEDLSLWRAGDRTDQSSRLGSNAPPASPLSAPNSGPTARPPLPLWLRRALGTYAPYLSDDLPDASASALLDEADTEEQMLLERLQRGQTPYSPPPPPNRSIDLRIAYSGQLANAAPVAPASNSLQAVAHTSSADPPSLPRSTAPATSSLSPVEVDTKQRALSSSAVHASMQPTGSGRFAPSERELAAPALTSGVAQRSSLDEKPSSLTKTSASIVDPTSQSTLPTSISGPSSERATDYPAVSTNPNPSDSEETKPDEENIFVQQYFERLNVSGKFLN